MTQKTSKSGRAFIEGFESCVLYVYDDLVAPVKGKYREWDGGHVKGTLTIGIGHTDAARHPLKITKGLRITREQAEEIFAVDIGECEEDVARLVTKPLTQGQFDACVSFTYNCGAGNFKPIAKRINAGNYSGARAAFDLYTKSKGVTLRGLQRRRDGEQVLWDSDVPSVPTEVIDHPAEVDQPPVATPKDLRSVSRKFVLFAWIKRIATFLGIGTGGTLTLADVTQKSKGLSDVVTSLVADPVLLAVVCASVAVVIVVGVLEAMGVLDYNEGRWTPSGAQ